MWIRHCYLQQLSSLLCQEVSKAFDKRWLLLATSLALSLGGSLLSSLSSCSAKETLPTLNRG